MSWWDDGSEVLGDVPADQIRAAWRRILSERSERRPSMDEALRAYARALKQAELHPPLNRLVLRHESQPERAYTGEQDAPADLVAAFAEVLPAIVQAYQRTLQRPPSPVEAAKTFEFVVGADPGMYVSEPASLEFWRAARLRAEPASQAPAGEPA